MKRLALLATGLAVVLAASPALSQDEAPPPTPPKPGTAPSPTPSPETPPVAPPPEPAPAPGGPLKALDVKIEPFASIVGGVKVDTIIEATGAGHGAIAAEHREGRVSAISVADFGLRGKIGQYVSFISELMANGGTSLHGSSAWEGQAALQVRQQLVRIAVGQWMIEAGRIIDEASLNFLSAHIGDTLYQDTAVRDPLLYSGFNMGNGLRGTFEPVPGFRAGLTFTAGNPTSMSSSLEVGGSFPPFDRIWTQPFQAVQQSPNTYPDDTFHMMVFAPSLMYTHELFEAKAEFQGYTIDINTNKDDDHPIRGYNIRGGVKFKLLDEKLGLFANGSLDRNDTVDPTNTSVLSPDKFTGLTYGGGVDFNYRKMAPGRFNGIGAQYDRVQFKVGDGNTTNLHYVNVGTSYWLNQWLAVGARFAIWLRNDVDVHDEGERSFIATLRLAL
jgi:hypothetical protein